MTGRPRPRTTGRCGWVPGAVRSRWPRPAGTSLAALPPGARIGTGSPRRAAQLRGPGLELGMVPVRGNVDARLRTTATATATGSAAGWLTRCSGTAARS